jgi:hypothetical protein
VLGLVALAGMAAILYVAPERVDEDREALDAAHDMDPDFVMPQPRPGPAPGDMR